MLHIYSYSNPIQFLFFLCHATDLRHQYYIVSVQITNEKHSIAKHFQVSSYSLSSINMHVERKIRFTEFRITERKIYKLNMHEFDWMVHHKKWTKS